MMGAFSVVAESALLLAAAGSALRAWKLRDALEQERALITAWALSALFIALAVPAQWLPERGNDLSVLRQMATNLAIYISLPLMAAAVIALGKGWFWSAAGWGRLLLGLFAGFELTRQMGYGSAYLQTLGVSAVAIGLGGALLLVSIQARTLATLGVLSLAAAFTLSPYTIFDWPFTARWQEAAVSSSLFNSLFNSLAALSLLLTGAALHIEIAARHAKQQSQ